MGNFNNGDRSTNIDYEAVQKSVDTILDCSKTMEGLFTDFTNEMSIIYQEDNFSGEASNSLQEKFNTLKKKFDGYKGAVERFSKVIEAAKQSAYQTEKEIQQEAEELNA